MLNVKRNHLNGDVWRSIHCNAAWSFIFSERKCSLQQIPPRHLPYQWECPSVLIFPVAKFGISLGVKTKSAWWSHREHLGVRPPSWRTNHFWVVNQRLKDAWPSLRLKVYLQTYAEFADGSNKRPELYICLDGSNRDAMRYNTLRSVCRNICCCSLGDTERPVFCSMVITRDIARVDNKESIAYC